MLPITAAARQPTEPAAVPDAGDVVAAFLELRRWIDDFAPPDVESPPSRLPIREAAGVCVLLRRSGRLVGSGASLAVRLEDPALMPRRAVGRALAEVLGDPSVASLPETLRDDVGRALTLELDVAGPLEPLPGRTYDQLARQVRPGLDGVALRRGNAWAVVFPAQLRATGGVERLPGRIAALASELGLPAMEYSALVDEHGISVYRFPTVHLAQERPAGPPFETMRGDRVVPLSAVSREGLTNFAAELASYLMRSLWPAPAPRSDEVDERIAARKALGLRGTYRPLSDHYEPLVAPPLEQALGAFALGRFGSSSQIPAEQRANALNGAQSILHDLAIVEPGEDDPRRDPIACAGIIYAATTLPASNRTAEIEALLDEAVAVVRSTYDPAEGFVHTDEDLGGRRALGPHSQAVVAGAMARLLTLPRSTLDREIVRAAIDLAWDAVPEHQRLNLLPWMGWAELEFVRATGEPIAHADRLRDLQSVLRESQVDATDPGMAPDLAGGFALVGPSSAGDWPTAQTTRPACILAAMLREPALTPASERAEAVVSQFQTMRFLMQLAVRDSLNWSMRNAQRARGGVRASLWESELEVPAQALGLIAAVETLESLEPAVRSD